jgi:hypothetical protein
MVRAVDWTLVIQRLCLFACLLQVVDKEHSAAENQWYAELYMQLVSQTDSAEVCGAEVALDAINFSQLS